MRLTRKFQKLFTRDAAESLWEHARRWTHPVSSRRILATIDKAELVKLREHYPYRPNARKINAYEDANYWVGVNVKRVQDLWLDRSAPLDILDLGCGPGYFLYLCRLFGHEGLGLDPDDEPFFRGTTKFFGVSRRRRTNQCTGAFAGFRQTIRSRYCASRVFPPASHGAKTVNGWNGQRLTGNSSSAMCARDSSNLMGDSYWNSIGARTALHFSHQNCARSLNRKARGSCVGRRYLLRIRISGRDSRQI